MPPIKVFVIDDDRDEIYFYKEALDHIASDIELSFFPNPERVVPFLDQLKEDQLPNAMIVDLNMPKVNGFELLREMKNSSRYRALPVIISSTSGSHSDKERCIEAGAKEYVVKPVRLTEYCSLLNRIQADSRDK